MNDFIIAVDSSCDLTLEDCKAIGVEPIRIKYQIDDNVYEDSMNTAEQLKFFEMMRQGAVPKTSQINTAEFLDFWRPFLEAGKPIVQLVLTSAISGTYNNLLNAAEMAKEEFPDAEIYPIDSSGTSGMLGIMTYKAAEFRNSGLTAAQTAAEIEKIKHNVHAVFTTNDLTYLYRGGRLSKGKFIVANALGIKPVLKCDFNGALYTADSVRGAKGILQKLTSNIKDYVINPEQQELFVVHGDNIEYAKQASDEILAAVPFKGVKTFQFGSTIGAHTGPGLIALFFIGTERE